MKCLWCDCPLRPEEEDNFTNDGEGPLCDDCYEEARESLYVRIEQTTAARKRHAR